MKEGWKQLEKWQKRDLLLWFLGAVLIAVLYIGYVTHVMVEEKDASRHQFDQMLQNDNEEAVALKEKYSQDAARVLCGTYVETIKEITLKNDTFRVVFTTWFRWNDEEGKFAGADFTTSDAFRIYNGYINKKEIIKDYHKDGVNYQEMRVDATISKNFATSRFPLGSHVLQFYIEPKYSAAQVVLAADKEKSGVNRNLNISGYDLMRSGVADHTIEYPNTMNNPRFTDPKVTTEVMTCLEVNRDSWGLYMKCFMALIGTMTWILITLYICANHHVNPLGTIPAALFGTVTNIMVGSNLLPDVIQLGLVEYVNFYGTMVILAGAFCIIHINRIRDTKTEQSEQNEQMTMYAGLFGKIMFYTILVLCLTGQILMPISAYIWG